MKYFKADSLELVELKEIRRGMAVIILISSLNQKKNKECELKDMKILTTKINKNPKLDDINIINF